ncbi:hypothetical protein AC249_AIPGENE22611 [Exaiptasia diaphana]|nr:hypothetical protein AC249_AIPGENE22611 [Exaiptasia diaphana]
MPMPTSDHLLLLAFNQSRQERRVYYLHRFKARKFPPKYLAVNKFFSSIVDEFIKEEPSPSDFKLLKDLVNSKMTDINDQFSIPPISAEFVERYLKSLDTTKAVGLDGLSPKILKISAGAISSSLATILNKSLSSVTDDGMDQQTKNLPNVRRMSKALSGLSTIGTQLVGAIIHSGQAVHGKEIYGSFVYYQWPHDPNLTDCPSKCAFKVEKYKLPPILYLKMDNCWMENKNQFMLALLGLMVQNKVFEKVSNYNLYANV